MQVKLSDGHVVHVKDVWTHGCEKKFLAVRDKGVMLRMEVNEGGWIKEIPSQNLNDAYEAVMDVVIEKIEKDGKEVPYSVSWLEGLPESEYDKIVEKIVELRSSQEPEEREKNTGSN